MFSTTHFKTLNKINHFIKYTKADASCKCFTVILYICIPIRIDYVLRENNIITSNGRRNRKSLNFNYKYIVSLKLTCLVFRYQYTANAPVLSDIAGSSLREKAHTL